MIVYVSTNTATCWHYTQALWYPVCEWIGYELHLRLRAFHLQHSSIVYLLSNQYYCAIDCWTEWGASKRFPARWCCKNISVKWRTLHYSTSFKFEDGIFLITCDCVMSLYMICCQGICYSCVYTRYVHFQVNGGIIICCAEGDLPTLKLPLRHGLTTSHSVTIYSYTMGSCSIFPFCLDHA